MLRDAVQRQLSAEPAGSNVCSPELTGAIRGLCAVARQRGLRAEEVVLLFKSIWAGIPATDYQIAAQRRTELLERAITLCITSYYATAD
jgi:hypothetical protein